MVKKLLLLPILVFLIFLAPAEVVAQECTAPSISLSNASGTSICDDQTITINATVTPPSGTEVKSYQWQLSLNGGSWNNINVTSKDLANYDAAVGNNNFRLVVGYACTGGTETRNVESTATGNITVYEKKEGSVTIKADKTSICPGDAVTYSITSISNHGGSSAKYQWLLGGQPLTGQTGNTLTYKPTGTDQISLKVDSGTPCVEDFTSNAISVTVNPAAPEQPGAITVDPEDVNEDGMLCPNSAATFSILPVDRATSYQWTLPSGWTGSSTGNSIDITTGAPGTGNTIKVKAINSCGESIEQTLSINVGPGKPATPSEINSPALICPQEETTLSVTNDSSLKYTWSVPSGWSIKSGQGSNQIVVVAGGYGESGNVSVYGTNACLDSDARTKSLTINEPAPLAPEAIDGDGVVCPGTDVTYSIPPPFSYADSYVWTYDGSILENQNGTSVTFPSGNPGAREITVMAKNECGDSPVTRRTITVDEGTPDEVSISSKNAAGEENVTEFCPQETGIIFSVPADDKVDGGYTWTVPTGWQILTNNGSSITVTSGNLNDDGNITVTAKSDHCGEVSTSFAVTVKNPAPSTAGITISGPQEVCHNETGIVYEIPAVDYATGYTWTVPEGWSFTGDGTNRITVSAGTLDGEITVVASNDCGNSGDPLILNVKSIDGVPAQPGAITASKYTVCPPETNFTLSVPEALDADSYEWFLPTGWEITAGQGTHAITVKINASSNYANPTVVGVEAKNTCGNSARSSTSSDINDPNAIAVSDYVYVNLGEDKILCKTKDQITIDASLNFGGKRLKIASITSSSGANLPVPSGSVDTHRITFTPTDTDLANGSVTLTLTTESPGGACQAGKDDMTIYFRNDPKAEISISGLETICYNSSSEVTFTGASTNSVTNAIVTYNINGGSDQTIQLNDSGFAKLPTGNLTANTTYNLVSIAYPDSPACSKPLSGSVTVTVVPDAVANFSYSGTPFCADQDETFAPVFGDESSGNYTGGTYTVNQSGLSIDANGLISPKTSTPGTYVITYTIPDDLNCGYNDEPVTTEVTILEAVQISEVSVNDHSLCEGETATFSVSASGDIGSYQWYKGTLGSGTAIQGATSETYTINAASVEDTGSYYVEVIGTSPCSSIFSGEISLDVYEEITIQEQPVNQSICESGSVTFSVTASAGEHAIAYQWQKDGTDITGATNSTFTIETAQLSDKGEYQVVIRGAEGYSCPVVTSTPAVLDVRETPIVEIAGSTAICEDMSTEITFSGTPNTTVTLILPDGSEATVNLDESGAGSYNTGTLSLGDGVDQQVFMYSLKNISYSSEPDCLTSIEPDETHVVEITVNSTPEATVSFENDQLFFCNGLDAEGNKITYTPKLTGSGDYEDGIFSGVGFEVNDPATGAFTPADLAPGNYTLVYTMSAKGGCEEQLASLDIVINEEVIITSQPFHQAVCTANSTQLEVAATGDNLSYEWFIVGRTEPVGTGPILEINNATAADGGEYYVVVSGENACESKESEHVFVTVDENIVIAEEDQPISQNICVGNEATLRVAATASGDNTAIEYQWQYRATAQDSWSDFGEMQTGAAFSEISTGQAGEYRVRIDGTDGYSCDTGYSQIATITTYEAPVVSAGPDFQVCSTETSIALGGTNVSASNHTSLVWTSNGQGQISNAADLQNAAYSPVAADLGTSITFTLTAVLEVDGVQLCADAVDSKVVTIVPQPEITEFSYISTDPQAIEGEFCETDVTTYTPHIAGDHLSNGTGSFASAPNSENGLLVDPVTGKFTPDGTTPGVYDITYTFTVDSEEAGCTVAEKIFTVTIGAKPIAGFSYENTAYCSDAENPLPVMAEGAITGTFSSTTGLVFADPLTGEINIAESTPGTYTITNTIASAEGCAEVTATTEITINAQPAAPEIENLSYCLNEEDVAGFNATPIEGGRINWYSSLDATTAMESAPLITTAEAVSTSYWASQTSADGCESDRIEVTVTINPLPEVSISVDESVAKSEDENPVICYGTTIVLTGNGASEYFWSADSGSGIVDLGISATLNVSPEVTTTYHVVGTDENGCSNTSQLIIEVSPTTVPGELTAPASVCIDNPAGELILSEYTGDIIRWEYQAEGDSAWTILNAGSTDSIQPFSGLTATTTFRATVKSGVCAEDFVEATVVIDELPEGGVLAFEDLIADDNDGTFFMICEGATSGYLPLTHSQSLGTVVAWKYRSGTGTWQTIGGAEEPFTGNVLSADQIQALGLQETTVFRVEVQSGACVPNDFSETAIISVIPTDIEPTPVTVDKEVVCLGEEVTLSSETGYSDGMPTIENGAFDNAGLKNHGWRFGLDGKDVNFETNANNTNQDFWSRATPHDFNTADYLNPPHTMTPQRWDAGVEDGNKGFALVSGKHLATMETNVFSIGSMDQAIVTFDQAYNLTPGATITVEISKDGGATYEKVLFTMTGSASSGNYSSFGTGTPKTRPKNKMVLDLGDYLGENNLRLRFTFDGARDGDLWAVDAIKLPEGPMNVAIEWNDYTYPDSPVFIGNTNSVKYVPTKIGLNIFEVKTRLIFDSTGNACDVAENGENIEVFVFDTYTTTVTAELGSCGNFTAQLHASVTNSKGVPVESYPTPDGYVGEWVIEGDGAELMDSNPSDTIPAANDPNAILSTLAVGTYKVSWQLTPTATNEAGIEYEVPDDCAPSPDPIEVVIQGCTQLDFDGVDDYVDLGTGYTDSYSIEAWVRPFQRTSEDGQTNPAAGTIISGANFEVQMADIAEVTPGTRWYHIAVSNGRLYIDGIDIKAAPSGSGGDRTLIGARWGEAGPENFFSGWIEEVRIWNGAISQEQIRFLMNQRLQNEANIGVEIPMPAPGLGFSDLAGYFQLLTTTITDGNTPNLAGGVPGRLHNMQSLQENTAPLPYTTSADGKWTDENATWTHHAVWDIPNAKGVDGTPVDWNIVRSSHNLTSENKDITLLGLISEAGELTIANPNSPQDETNSGQFLFLSHYLKLNGSIDLVGESQLLQPDGSIVDAASTGFLERDQQGTASSYNYNYWSSPVSPAANNAPYTVASVMKDGTNATQDPIDLSFGNAYTFADGDYSTPRKISNYWLFKFHGTANDYGTWFHVGSTGSLKVGEGYSMKGTSGKAAIEDLQNYTFKGLPNNGNVNLNIGQQQNYLIGNPYPSAIDAHLFILDNMSSVTGGQSSTNVFNGTLYFWSHFAGKTHLLEEYIGGYATYNLSGGTVAFSNDTRIDNSNPTRSGGEEPDRFIPVGQGFFVNTAPVPGGDLITISGGDIQFKNSQRVYHRETDGQSVFHKPEDRQKGQKVASDSRAKIWLKYESPKGYHRQLLVTADPNASNGFDLGYDAPMIENNAEDMYWYFNDYEFVIQGVAHFDQDQKLPLGFKTKEEGAIKIRIDKLKNIPDDMPIYLRDSVQDVYHDLREGAYESAAEGGTVNDRFSIVFSLPQPEIEEPPVDDEEPIVSGDFEIIYVNGTREVLLKNPRLVEISRIYLHNVLGQQVMVYYDIPEQAEVKLPVNRFSAGVYIVKVHTADGIKTKKIIIE